MSITSNWFDAEKTVILHEIVGRVHVGDVLKAIYNSIETLNVREYQPKYFIFDLRKVVGIPQDILGNRLNYDLYLEDNHVTILIGAHPIIKTSINALKRMNLIALVFFVNDFEEAQALIDLHKQS